MPKLVDYDQRREQIAESTWEVIRTDGVEGATVRRIAEHAGLSLGSLRHYFATQAELIAFSMRLVSERVHKRIAHLAFTGDPRDDIQKVILELVPLDEERQIESEVWYAMSARSLVDPALREQFLAVHDELYRFFMQAVQALTKDAARPGPASGSADEAEWEARRLHAMVDGLVLHRIAAPDRTSPEDIVHLVQLHLDRLVHN